MHEWESFHKWESDLTREYNLQFDIMIGKDIYSQPWIVGINTWSSLSWTETVIKWLLSSGISRISRL